MYPRGTGADVIVVIGNAGFTKDTSKVFTFSSYLDARQDHATVETAIGPEPADWTTNPLLKAVKDIFEEGAIRSVTDQFGIDKVYCINVGSAPSSSDYTAAMTTAATLFDARVELYVGLNDASILASLSTRLETLEQSGDYRNAIVTVATDATDAQMKAMTDTAQEDYVRGERVHIHTDRNMQAKYAAKMACSPYHQDPAYGPYRTVTPEQIVDRTNANRDELIEAGLVVDWVSKTDPTKAEPCMAVSTAYRLVSGTRSSASLAHARRNADHQFRETDKITLAHLKRNNTTIAKGLIEESARAYLKKEVTAGYLIAKSSTPTDDGFLFELQFDPSDPYKLIRNRKVRPVGAVYTIDDYSIIQVPIAGGT